MPRALWWSYGGGAASCERSTPVGDFPPCFRAKHWGMGVASGRAMELLALSSPRNPPPLPLHLVLGNYRGTSPIRHTQPPRITINPWEQGYCRVLGGCVFSWARYPCMHHPRDSYTNVSAPILEKLRSCCWGTSLIKTDPPPLGPPLCPRHSPTAWS